MQFCGVSTHRQGSSSHRRRRIGCRRCWHRCRWPCARPSNSPSINLYYMYKGLLAQQGRMTGMEGGVLRGKGGESKNREQSRVGEGAVKLSRVRGVYNGDRYHSRGATPKGGTGIAVQGGGAVQRNGGLASGMVASRQRSELFRAGGRDGWQRRWRVRVFKCWAAAGTQVEGGEVWVRTERGLKPLPAGQGLGAGPGWMETASG